MCSPKVFRPGTLDGTRQAHYAICTWHLCSTSPGGETTMSTLADLVQSSKPTGHRLIELFCRPSNNLGAITLTTSIDVGTFLNQSKVGNDAALGHVTQRPLNEKHAAGMAAFNLSALINYTVKDYEAKYGTIPNEVIELFDHVSRKSYYSWAPLVCSVRFHITEVLADRMATGEYSVKLRPDQLLWVVDGQHRRVGLEFTRKWLEEISTTRKYPRVKDAFPPGMRQVGDEALAFWRMADEKFQSEFSITTEIHFGMTIDQERQLFYFLNDLGRAVPAAISQAFDQDNPINLFTQSVVGELFPVDSVEMIKPQVNWEDEKWIRLDSLNGINARLLLNHGSIDGAKASVVNPRLGEAREFWEVVTKIPGVFDRKSSLAAQPAMLKAIAKCYYDLKWARGSGRKALPADISTKFLSALPMVDFGHKNLMWQTAGGNKNIGSLHADGTFRFSPSHNEIVPVLAAALRQKTNTL